MSKSSELILRRSTAYILDIILLFLVLAPTAFLVEAIFDIQPQTRSQVWVAAVMSFSIPAWAYFLVSDLSHKGATVGKRIMKVRVVSTTSDDLNFGRALIRTAVKLLPWETAHIFGFALADSISESVLVTGLVVSNLLVLVYLVVLFMNSGKKSMDDFPARTEVELSKASADIGIEGN